MTLPTAPRVRRGRTGDDGKGIVQLALRTAIGEELEILFSGIDAWDNARGRVAADWLRDRRW